MRFVFALLVLFAVQAPVFGQKAPEIGYVYPPVVRAGTTTKVQLGGYDFTPDMQFFVHDKRVMLDAKGEPGTFFIPEPPYWFGPKGGTTAFPIPREVPATITIPKDFPPGLVRWQVANANGASKAGSLFVTAGPVVRENRDRDKPQTIPNLPASVAGRIRKIAEVDRYVVIAKQSGPITVELFARRLGSEFNGAIQAFDSSGRKLADVADTEGFDTAITFAAKAGEQYTVQLQDAEYRGHRAYVYRLEFTTGPRVVHTIPAAGTRGKTIDVKFFGYGIATGGAKFESVTRKVTFPAGASRVALRYQLKTPFGRAPVVDIPVSDLIESAVPTAGSMHTLSVPGAITGRLNASNRATFRFVAKKGDVFDVAAISRALGGGLDLSMRIDDAIGKKIAANDDLTGTTDAGLTLRISKDGTYTCIVEDVSGQNGRPNAVYRLAFSRPVPSYTLTSPQFLNLPLTGKANLTVKAIRSGGFQGEVSVTVRGLPADMRVPAGLKIPAKKNSVAISIERTANAASHAAVIEIVGTATIDGKTVTRTATAATAGKIAPRDLATERTTSIILATTMKPPVSVELVDKNRQRAVHRGTTYPAEFIIRRDKGFTGEVLLQMAARQSRHRQGIFGPVVVVPAGVDRALYPSFLPEWLETDRTTRMVVMGVAKVKDPQGKVRYLTKPANARITMILEGALLKVSHQARELTVSPGESFTIPVRIARSVKLQGNVTVGLDVPKQLRGLVSCAPVVIPADQLSANLVVKTTAGKSLAGRWRFAVKANALQDKRWPVVSQTIVSVEFSSPRSDTSATK